MRSRSVSLTLSESSESEADALSGLRRPLPSPAYGRRRRSTPIPDAYVRSSLTRRMSQEYSPAISEDDAVPESRRPSGIQDTRLQYLSQVQRARVIMDVVDCLAGSEDWVALSVYLGAVGQFMTMQVPDNIQLGPVRLRLSDRIALSEERICAEQHQATPNMEHRVSWVARLFGCANL